MTDIPFNTNNPNGETGDLNFLDNFQFSCNPDVKCFTDCCADVTIFLAPYDVVRLKNRLEMTASDFLEKYSYILATSDQMIPVVVLKMDDNEKKSCPFVSEQGCGVYEDRPWPCRMYPLNIHQDESFSIMADAEKCLGLKEQQEMKVIEWIEGQGIFDYQRTLNYYSEITEHPKMKELDVTNTQIKSMIHMALYDMDKFRDFVFKSSFLNIFDLDENFIEQLRVDDSDLLHFGMDWIKFGLFGEPTLTIRDQVRAAYTARDKEGADQ